MKQARIEIRIKNKILHDSIYKNYKSAAEFSVVIGMSEAIVSAFLNLKRSPWIILKDGSLKISEHAQKIADHFYIDVEELFPEKLYTIKNNKIVIEKEIDSIPMNGRLLIESQSPEAQVMNGECRKTLDLVIGQLTEREQRIIRGSFFEDKSLSELGEEFNVTAERIRQEQKRALRRLRHPSRSIKLNDFYYTDRHEGPTRIIIKKEL